MRIRLGILGAGKLGTTVARLAVAAGIQVAISDANSGPMVELIVATVAPGARLVGLDEMVRGSDIVLLAIPYSHLDDLDLRALSSVVLVDATNPWLETDGADPPPSPVHQAPGLRVVRSLNHLAHEDLMAYAEPAGTPFRTAVAVSSDDVEARQEVATLVDALGFDPVQVPAQSAWLLNSNGPLFGRRLSRPEMEAIVSASRRADRLKW